jgi:hypothetical protein
MAKTIAPFYNVDTSVGRGGVNSRTDVMLVQYMLWHIMIQSVPNWVGQFIPAFPNGPDGIGPEAIFPHNGIYTRDLDQWIVCFQQTCNQYAGHSLGGLTTDGHVDVAPGGWGKRSSGRPTWYTIQAMNKALWIMNGASFANLPNLSDVPVELTKDLTRFQFAY